jgi:hypothetical protein
MNSTGSKLEYVKAEPISLKGHPEFSEVWLHERISKDTSILGLGELTVIQRERVQVGAGRLDMLLTDADAESNVRYEVEIMLGPTDPSHIIFVQSNIGISRNAAIRLMTILQSWLRSR